MTIEANKSYKTEKPRPLVSWLIPTTFDHHRWWKRLAEFLQEDFPSDLIECIFFCSQYRGFAKKAKVIGERIANSLSFLEGVSDKWQNVKFVENYTDKFNLPEARTQLKDLATGDILIHRDADVAIIQYGFTKYMIENLIKYKLGLLGLPSLNNGKPFKPRVELEATRFPQYCDITLSSSVNGMAVATLKTIEDYVGRNPGVPQWGDATTFSLKLARCGFSLAYQNGRGYWLATASEESPISITDENKNAYIKTDRHCAIAMLNDFYKVEKSDIFWKIQQTLYKTKDTKRNQKVKDLIKRRYPIFTQHQRLDPRKEKFHFKPWECLRHPATDEYISNAAKRAAPFYEPVIQRIRRLGLSAYFNLPEKNGFPK